MTAPPKMLQRRVAFTLVELVVACTIMGVLAAALSSAMLIASQSMDNGRGSLRATMDEAEALQQIAAELSLARSVTTSSGTTVTFTVADRDANGTDETITYAWAGTSGNPLTRSYNGGSPVTVLTDVTSLQFVYSVSKNRDLLGWLAILGLGSPDQTVLQSVTIKVQAGLAVMAELPVEILNHPVSP